ncbi:MAG: hypothetical protein K2Q06_01455, partial [Parvularculaceae bacterium]|nr:hypothetical protein [Parvularculaceae bacterium]
ALTIESDNAFGWFELARAYGGLGEEPLANLATAESRYHVGQRAEAGQFARRAMEGLVKNTPEWRRANDILLTVAPDGPAGRQKRPDEEAPAPQPSPTDDVPDPQ